MAFDSQTRNKLQRMVGACRRLLTDEFDDQLQGLYGIYAQDGRVLELEKLTTLDDDDYQIATLLRDRVRHLTSGMASEKQPLAEAVRRVLREQAFTVLNRFAALRMAEERGFVQECVGQGLKSKGFQVFETVARSGLGGAYERYVTFIHGMFDELSLDLGVLFDRWSPFGLLFPREPALLKFFDLLNDPELKPLWKEDETVGWIYQYFNDEAERKKMREESSAPRNSRELAVRNQFFTPRYVVEFLTDNTLGRIWYEMTRGVTKLKEQCRYLVRRPNEIFLKPGDKAPEQPKQDNLSQEDLLKQPVHTPHRPLKDPRTILMLDPACGSMHFGLYAFDLFEVIYEEAWELEKRGAEFQSRPPGMLSLQETYGTKEDFLKDVPRLMIEHNLHGIDIDPRCAQIAGLSLWLRAQKAWQRLGLKPAERPAIKRSNIVCAEPMPGEKELLREFVEREFPAEERGVCLRLLEAIFDKMQLAGEAGSLLKIEEEIRSAIEDARQQWQTARQRPEFFDSVDLAKLDKRAGAQQELPAAERASLAADLRSLTSEDFWARVEERIYAALRDYAEQAENGGGFQRRLFAEDAARGFAFIGVCRKRYDVALMNPPFGDPTKGSKTYLGQNYIGQPYELYADFVERATASAAYVGAITSHTFLTYGSLADYRRRVLMPKTQMRLLADFGLGVMDAAMVRAAAYVLDATASGGDGVYFRLVEDEDKQTSLELCLRGIVEKIADQRRFIAPQSAFLRTDQCSYAYWAESLLSRFDPVNSIGEKAADILLGVVTSGNDQFLRLAWEVSPKVIGTNGWAFYCKGGDFQKYFRAPHLVIDWRDEGNHIAAGNSFGVRLRDTKQYFRPGMNFPLVNEFGINVSVLPGNCVFDNTSPSAFPKNTHQRWLLLGLLNSRVVEFFIRCLTSTRHWQVGYVRQVPWPSPTEVEAEELSKEVREACLIQQRMFATDETLQGFSLAEVVSSASASIKEAGLLALRKRDKSVFDLIQCDHRIDEKCTEMFRLSRSQRELVKRIIGPHQAEMCEGIPLSGNEDISADAPEGARLRIHRVTLSPLENEAWKTGTTVEKITRQRAVNSELMSDEIVALCFDAVSYWLGCGFGRWDIRYATGEKAVPELPDPFAPLPVCPPGQLQNAQGLPARPEDVPAAYPVRIPWDGILVDDPNHPLDIERCVREVIEIIWKDRAEAIEHEACEILGVKSLRDYFRKPAGFFADHLKRYSKSRRQAPIYWPLSTASGSYILWIYYHRLTDQTLFQCVNDFVKPKLEEVNRDIERLRGELQRADGGSSKQREMLEGLEDFTIELKEFHDELLRVAGLPYKPNLNDGVIITAGPLWKLFRLPKWQKDLKACWEALEAGEYDWAHIALTIRPNEVREKCKADRSIAIAHGLEDLCEVKALEKKVKRGKKKTDEEQPDLPQD